MSHIEPISKERHAGMYWRRYSSYLFSADTHLAPIVADELQQASKNMPIAFVPREDCFLMVAVLSPFPGKNLYVNHKGKWLGNYVPACFRSYPFRLARIDGNNKMVLCVDEDSGLVSDTPGEPFFDENGDIAWPIKEVLDFLQKVEHNRNITELAVSALNGAGLIVKWPIRLESGNEEKTIGGLYKIDEEKLNKLGDDSFLKLRNTASLPVAYAHLLSQSNMAMIERLTRFHEKDEPPPAPDLDKIFGEEDIFKF